MAQIAVFDASEPGAQPRPRPVLPAIYAPVEEYQIVQLATPLACMMIDTGKLEFCGQLAAVAFAWLVEDEREGAVWRLRPVCGGCVAVGI